MTTPAPPGWYDDPENSVAQRYWDGQSWTPHRQRKSAAPTTPDPASVAPPPLPPPPPAAVDVKKVPGFWLKLTRPQKLLIVGGAAAVVALTCLFAAFSVSGHGPGLPFVGGTARWTRPRSPIGWA